MPDASVRFHILVNNQHGFVFVATKPTGGASTRDERAQLISPLATRDNHQSEVQDVDLQ